MANNWDCNPQRYNAFIIKICLQVGRYASLMASTFRNQAINTNGACEIWSVQSRGLSLTEKYHLLCLPSPY